METITFPPVAQERIRLFQVEMKNLESQLQQFADGVLIGLGVDVASSDVSVDLGSMVATITPKKTGEVIASPVEGDSNASKS